MDEVIRNNFYSIANSYLNSFNLTDNHFLISGKDDLEYSYDIENQIQKYYMMIHDAYFDDGFGDNEFT